MADIGGDTAHLQNIEAVLRRHAEEVTTVKTHIRSTLESANWRGPAAERFKGQWRSEFARMLDGLSQALEEQAQYVRRTQSAFEQIGG
jgi:uncharacterized protein YukE